MRSLADKKMGVNIILGRGKSFSCVNLAARDGNGGIPFLNRPTWQGLTRAMIAVHHLFSDVP